MLGIARGYVIGDSEFNPVFRGCRAVVITQREMQPLLGRGKYNPETRSPSQLLQTVHSFELRWRNRLVHGGPARKRRIRDWRLRWCDRQATRPGPVRVPANTQGCMRAREKPLSHTRRQGFVVVLALPRGRKPPIHERRYVCGTRSNRMVPRQRMMTHTAYVSIRIRRLSRLRKHGRAVYPDAHKNRPTGTYLSRHFRYFLTTQNRPTIRLSPQRWSSATPNPWSEGRTGMMG